MPPQLTNVSTGIDSDAARRSLNLAIASAKSAIDQALTARLKASAAALENALPDKGAAEPLGLLKRSWDAFWRQRRDSRVSLQDLSDRALMDIGLTRGEIDHLTPQRAIERLRDSTRIF
jgi:uncharacterized protein YjiS (DUF1127 family)